MSGAYEQRRVSGGVWVPKPPDGGWGWVIVVASFGVNFVWGGLRYGYGILHKEFLEYFGGSRGYTSLIGSVLSGVGYGAGIIGSILISRYGIRPVAIVGGAIAGVACALCIFANSISALIFLFGGGVGIGHALSYTAAYIIVPYYFEKRRGMATGVAIAGSGIGNIVCAPLMRYLVAEYTWRGFVVIQGGIILQCCVFGALFRAVPMVRLDVQEAGTEEKDAGIPEEEPEMAPMLKDVRAREQDAGVVDPQDSQAGHGPLGGRVPKAPESSSNGPLIPRVKIAYPDGRSRKYSDVTEYAYTQARHSPVLPSIPESGAEVKKQRRRLYSQQLIQKHRTFSFDGSAVEPDPDKQPRRYTGAGAKPFLRKDIYFANSLLQLDEYKSNPDLFWQSALSIPVATTRVGHDDDAHRAKTSEPRGPLPEATLWTRLNDVIGLDLLRRADFLMFALAIFALYFSYYVPVTVLYDFALDRGVPKEYAVVLVSVMGVANTLGRVLLGSVADFRCVNRTIFFSMIMFLMGTSCCFCVFYTNFYIMAVYAAVFAACVGASKAMTLIVTVDLLGLENLTHAYGLLLLFQGCGFIIGNPFAGWLHDVTKSYVMSFSIIGAVLILSGLLILIASRVKRVGK